MSARFARYDDLEGIMDLYEVLVPNDILASLDTLKQVWDKIMSDAETYRYAVCEEGGRLVATSNMTLVPNLTRSGRPYAVIENVVTHPDARRKGYGRATIQMLLDYAREKGCYKVFLLSGSHRKEAHQFYISMGFDGDIKRGFTYDMK